MEGKIRAYVRKRGDMLMVKSMDFFLKRERIEERR